MFEENADKNRLVVAPVLRFVGVGLLLACAAVCAETLTGQVVSVADGDTLTIVAADKTQHRIRLDGIDAPERTQPYSQRSRQSLADMTQRQQVTAECSKIDRFGRDVCKVLIDGRDVGLIQIQRGLAWHFKRYEGEQSPQGRRSYTEAEQEARAAKRGLWRDPDPLAPWDFRAGKRQREPI